MNKKYHYPEYDKAYSQRPYVKERANAKAKAWHQVKRLLALSRLGGVCVRCGFSDPRALQVDHIHGGGKKEARERKGAASYWNYLSKLDAEALFARYQLLCANCNAIKRIANAEN